MSLQEQTPEKAENVVSLMERSKPQAPAEQVAQPKEELSFGEVMRRNEEIRDRMRKERLKANQQVLRSYRIKNS